MKKILITGATGLVGQEIVKVCHENNIDVHYLTTSRRKLESQTNYKGFYWNPSEGVIDVNCFKGVDVIINLAGASVSRKWTKAYKQKLLNSRLETLGLLHKTIKEERVEIKQLVSASAIGIYPDSKTHFYEEDFNEKSASFLGQVVEKWEDAADQFKSLNIRVAKIRIGLVLSNQGGALMQLIKPIKAFVGSPIGSGKQWQSWIHIHDLAHIFLFVVQNNLEGIFNGVAPNAVKQTELIKAIGKTLSRPIIMPKVPSFVMRMILGEMSTLVLESQRVSSKKVEQLGFHFKYHQLKPALEDLL